LVTRFCEADLQWANCRFVEKVIGDLITAGRRCILSCEDRGSGGRTIDTGGVSIGEIDAAGCEPIDIWRMSAWCFAQATDPVVHVIDGDEEDVGLG